MKQKATLKSHIENLKYEAAQVKKLTGIQFDEDSRNQLPAVFLDILGAIHNAADLIELQCSNMGVNLESYLRLEEKNKNGQGEPVSTSLDD
jgi:hypothetical protein